MPNEDAGVEHVPELYAQMTGNIMLAHKCELADNREESALNKELEN